MLKSSVGTCLSGFSKIKAEWDREIAKALRVSDDRDIGGQWRLHDIHRIVATGMRALQVRTEIIEAVLNHLSGVRNGIVGVYQCYDYQAEKRLAMEVWGQHVEGLGDPRDKNSVFR